LTERLYYQDSYLKEFKARILQKVKINNRPAVILDRTAFYPTSGGQPYDKGIIQDIPVVEVVEENDNILHILGGELKEEPNREVVGKIDWERRFDHMQQHSGQHILSGALMKIGGLETLSFHLGEGVCTLDVAKDQFTEGEVRDVEECANAIVWENRPIKCYLVEGTEELKKLNLRKIPQREGKIRIVEVEGFDLSACGGTHCRASGEIGLIKITQKEKRGENIRLEFICGKRAWEDYFGKHERIKGIARRLTVKDTELGEVIERMLEEKKEEEKKLKELKEKLLDYEAREIIKESSWQENDKGEKIEIIKKLFEGKDFAEVRELGQKIIQLKDRVVVLFGVKEGKGVKIIFACSYGLNYDLNALVREAGKFIEGRGGGTYHLAQAGGKKAEGIEEALDFALVNLENFTPKQPL